MKTTKLWIFSFIFGLLATACFYFFMHTKSAEKPALAAISIAQTNKTAAATVPKVPSDSLNITNEKRAVSIEVKGPEGISGYITAGAYVDVVANMTPPKSAPAGTEDEARILLQNVKVLAVGAASDDANGRKNYKLVTLEVSPNQGLALSFATRYDLYLMLRNAGDNSEVPSNAPIRETDLHKGVFSN